MRKRRRSIPLAAIVNSANHSLRPEKRAFFTSIRGLGGALADAIHPNGRRWPPVGACRFERSRRVLKSRPLLSAPEWER
jgi:hypothetical protein